MTKTSAVAALQPLPIDAPDSLVDVEIEIADPTGHDLLIDVKAVSVNPVDVKVRASFAANGHPKILGYDGAGIVVDTGPDASRFKVGDEVFWAGSIGRTGSNAGLQLVDERIVGRKPSTVDFAEAAALPLTAITAWESLFDHWALTPDSEGTLVVLAGAGGVGSIITQLAKRLTNLQVIATASRSETADYATKMGADAIANHHNLVDEVVAIARNGVDYVFTPFSAGNVENFAKLLKPRGSVIAIDDPKDLNISTLKSKSQAWIWEFMFTRPLHEPESTYQHELLNEVSNLVDEGVLVTTLTQRLKGLNAASLIEAHRQVESSATVGKVVIER